MAKLRIDGIEPYVTPDYTTMKATVSALTDDGRDLPGRVHKDIVIPPEDVVAMMGMDDATAVAYAVDKIGQVEPAFSAPALQQAEMMLLATEAFQYALQALGGVIDLGRGEQTAQLAVKAAAKD
jgi:hypothetical protein